MTEQQEDSLAAFRGSFPKTALSARRIAAALEAPGCHRRAVLEASAVNIEKLGSLVTGNPADRQSPFAISRGNQFEQRVTDNGMAAVVALVREHLNLSIPEVRQVDLSAQSIRTSFPSVSAQQLNDVRARLTRQRLNEMTTNPSSACNLIRHAMTRLNFGGEVAYLEQDVLAFAIEGRIHVVEIKSYPRIDGQADPQKASATVRQAAVYVLSLRETMEAIGASPELIETRVMIVLPENLSFQPVAAVVDTELQVRRLRRQLDAIPAVAHVLDGLPDGTALPNFPGADSDEATFFAAQTAARVTISQIPPHFADGCASCPLFSFCREEAERQWSISRLGSEVAGLCGSVTNIQDAVDLAEGRRIPADASEEAVATVLSRGAMAIRMASNGGAQ
jgi:hypothetical protein